MKTAGIDTRAKLGVLFIALLVCVTTPPDRFGAFACYFAVLLLALASCRISWRTVGRRLLILVPLLAAFAVFTFIRSQAQGHGSLALWNVVAKGCFGVLAVTLLTESTPFPNILRALEQLHCPMLLVLLTGFIYRYVWVLTAEIGRMTRACECRMYRGRWIWQAALVGRLIAILFLRSYERGERVYIAMVSRGFEGQFPSAVSARLRPRDAVFLVAAVGVFLGVRVAAFQ